MLRTMHCVPLSVIVSYPVDRPYTWTHNFDDAVALKATVISEKQVDIVSRVDTVI